MEPNVLDIGLICVGSVLRVPIVVCNNNANDSVAGVVVDVDAPTDFVRFISASLQQGTFDNVNSQWNVGDISKDTCLVGEISYLVIDDSVSSFKFNYTIVSDCAECNTVTGCVELEGISCTELRKCDPEMAENDIVVCGSGHECTGDVSVNDSSCPSGLERTYKWIDTGTANGTIVGNPDEFTYTPEEGFCGQAFATYGLYCNDVLLDTAKVRFDVTCAQTATDECFIYFNDISDSCTVSGNDFGCLFGATTTWNLVTDPTANGNSISEETSSSDVYITAWDQSTGAYTARSFNDFSGEASFYYTIRCLDSDSNVVYESQPTKVTLTVDTSTYHPGYAPVYAPTYTPIYTPTYAPVYTPIYTPTYAPTYTPGYVPSYAPTYTPVYTPASGTPAYAPTYIPFYAPTYAPTYTPTYAPTYAPVYTPVYAPVYTPVYAPTYAPTYTPTPYSPTYVPTYAPSYAPTYTPIYTPTTSPVYAPVYSPVYTPVYAPTYAPVYTPVYAPVYTPVYAPTYAPTYTPIALQNYTPSYVPSAGSPAYTPTYAPTYAPFPTTPAYTPIYAPTYAPFPTTPTYTPTYAPTYAPFPTTPTYTPTYAPTYAPFITTPGYTPTYAPTYAPFITTPAYTPTYAPVYTPIYTPTYTPTYTPVYTPTYAPTP